MTGQDDLVQLFVLAQEALAEWERLRDRMVGTVTVPQRTMTAMDALRLELDRLAPTIEAAVKDRTS